MKSTTTSHPRCLSSDSLQGDPVKNRKGEDVGEIKEFMIDLNEGRIAYAVLSFGGILGMGNKLFAVPWSSLELDTEEHCFILDVDKEKLKKAPGFEKDNWPDLADPQFHTSTYDYYGASQYWK